MDKYFKLFARVFLGLVILIGGFFPLSAGAASVSTVDLRVEMWQEHVIEGSGFNTSALQGQICWGERCLADSAIKVWSDNKIIFQMNTTGMPPSGQLAIVYWDACAYKIQGACRGDWANILGGQVNVAPYIDYMTVDGFEYDVFNQKIPLFGSNQTVEIAGEYFGTEQGRVFFKGKNDMSLTLWSNDLIRLTSPEHKEQISAMSLQNTQGLISEVKVLFTGKYSNDPYIFLQAYLNHINFWPFYEKKTGISGEGIVVAVIDSGINWNHPDFLEQLAVNPDEVANNGLDDDGNGYIDDYLGYDFIFRNGGAEAHDGHGSMVGGVIAAKVNNGTGIVGIAPDAKIMPLIACGVTCFFEDVVEAIYYAVDNGADIVNLSLGGLGYFGDFTQLFDDVIDYAYARDVVIVSAAGNGDFTGVGYGRNLNVAPNSPVCNDRGQNKVVGVASIEHDSAVAFYSDYGSDCIDVVAYGSGVFSLSHPAYSSLKIDFDRKDGTSFAAPQVAGAAALLLSQKPELTVWEVQEYLRLSGKELDGVNTANYKGQLGKALDIDTLLNLQPDKGDFPDMVLGVAEFSGEDLYLEGNYFARDSYAEVEYELKGDGDEGGDGNEGGVVVKKLKISEPFERFDLLKLDLKTLKFEDLASDKVKIKVKRYDGDSVSKEFDFVAAYQEQLAKGKYGGVSESDGGEERASPFSDLSENHKNFPAIYSLYQLGIFKGYPDGTFKAENDVNRAELLKILVEGKGVMPKVADYAKCFPDVSEEWFAPYVCFALKEGWVNGYPDGTFKPANIVNKVEALKMLLNSQQLLLPSFVAEKPFADVPVGEWFTPFVAAASELGILEEGGPNYFPALGMKRAGIAEYLYRLLSG